MKSWLLRTTASVAFALVTLRVHAAPVGNINCGDAEYFKPFEFIENPTPGPTGTNVGIIADGYFIVIFAPDSGRPPGEFGIYDMANLRSAVERKHIEDADTAEFREAHSLPVALIGDKEYVAVQTIRGVQIWDISDPLNAARVSKLNLPGISGGDYDNVAWQATWQGRYLYVSGANQGIYVIDTIDPTLPKLLAQVPTSKTGGFRVGPLYAAGDYLVISNMDQAAALAVLDISRPEAPALLGQKSGLPRLYTTLVAADRIYGAGRDGVLTIHSFVDPTDITEVKTFTLTQDSLYVAYQDGAVFSGRQDNFVKVDVTNELDPKIVGEGTLGRTHPDHGQVTPFGNLVYVGNDHGSGSAFFCHERGRDEKPPKVERIYPADGGLSVARTSRITISFSDYIDTGTITTSNVAIRTVGGAPLTGMYTYAFNTLSFSPDQLFAENQTYEIVMPQGGIKDVMGNALAEQVLARFSTGTVIDTTPHPIPGGAGFAGQSSGGSASAGPPPIGGFGGSSAGAGGSASLSGGNAGSAAAERTSDAITDESASCACGVPGWKREASGLFALMFAALGLLGRRTKRKAKAQCQPF